MKKIIFQLIIFVAIAILAGFLISQTFKANSIIKNEYFSLSLPGAWQENENRGGDFIYAWSAATPDFNGLLTDTTLEYRQGAEITIHVEKEKELADTKSNEIKSEEINISGKKAFLRTFEKPDVTAGRLFDIKFISNQYLYSIGFGYNPNTYPDGEKVFQKILDSLKIP
ncbi:hypothetical protein HYV44_00245 [Candidatus Microgenomates bacterium]|nr:hypothetical protein [Candidatus Microgenomates bacterium]